MRIEGRGGEKSGVGGERIKEKVKMRKVKRMRGEEEESTGGGENEVEKKRGGAVKRKIEKKDKW